MCWCLTPDQPHDLARPQLARRPQAAERLIASNISCFRLHDLAAFLPLSPPLPSSLGLIVSPIYFPSSSAVLFSLGCRKPPNWDIFLLWLPLLANIERGGAKRRQEEVEVDVNSSHLREEDVIDR